MNIFIKSLKFKSMCIISILSFFVFLESSVNAAVPTVKQAIPNQVAHNAEPFNMTVLTHKTFNDLDNDGLDLSFKKADDSALPTWLSVQAKPIFPNLVDTCDTPHIATDVVAIDNYAYVADYNSGLQVINITDHTNATIAGTFNTPTAAVAIAVAGNYAYVADWDSLQIIDISTPPDPNFVEKYDVAAKDVVVIGDYAYVAGSGEGLQIINISNPASPWLAGSCVTPGGARGVAVAGNYAYVADWTAGLQIIDISNFSDLNIVETYSAPGIKADKVIVVGNYAYVTTYDSGLGLQIIDISDPDNPTLAGSYPITYASDVEVVGNYAYVATIDGTTDYLLTIIDVSIPSSPNLVGTYSATDNIAVAKVVGNYAYLADGSGGLKILSGINEGSILSGTPGYSDMGVLNLKATANDGVDSVSTPFSINVLENPINNKPTVTAQEYKKAQNANLQFSKEQFIAAFHDDDDNDELSKIQIMSLPDYGKLKLSGVDVWLDQEIDVGDIDNLSYVPEKDWKGTTTFDWRGFDGITYSDEGVVTIKVSAADKDWLEAWWPVITGTTLAVVGVVTTVTATVVGAVLAKKAKKCCFKGKEEILDLEDLEIKVKKQETVSEK